MPANANAAAADAVKRGLARACPLPKLIEILLVPAAANVSFLSAAALPRSCLLCAIA
jgi:hypothetical protein